MILSLKKFKVPVNFQQQKKSYGKKKNPRADGFWYIKVLPFVLVLKINIIYKTSYILMLLNEEYASLIWLA